MSKRTRIWDVFPSAIEKTLVVIVLILVGVVAWASS